MKKYLILISFFLLISLIFVFFIVESNIYSYNESNSYYEYYNIPYGNHKRNKLDLTIPKKETNGLILFIHGGSWMSGNKENYKDNLISWTLNNNYAACAINYRFITGIYSYIDILEDINNALSKVKDIANTKNTNLTKVLLTGHSAGGHLSLLYAYSKYDIAPIKPCCVVNLSGPTNLTDANYYSKNNLKVDFIFSFLTNKIITKSNYLKKCKFLNDASPINYINEFTVPTITAHGVKDSVVPYSNATTLHNILNQYNVENILIPFENSDHGLENDIDKSKLLNEFMLEYANKYLK